MESQKNIDGKLNKMNIKLIQQLDERISTMNAQLDNCVMVQFWYNPKFIKTWYKRP